MTHIKNFNEFINGQHINEYWSSDDDAAQEYYEKQEKIAYEKFEKWAKMNKYTRTFNDLPEDELGNKFDTEKIGTNTYKWKFVVNTPIGKNPNKWFLYTDDHSCTICEPGKDGFYYIPNQTATYKFDDQSIFENLYTDI